MVWITFVNSSGERLSQIVRILFHQMIESRDGARARDNIMLFQEIRVTTYFPHGSCTCWSQSAFCESSQRTLLDCKHVLDNRQETVWRILLTVVDDKIQLPVRILMYSFQNKSLGHHRESRFPVLVWESKRSRKDNLGIRNRVSRRDRPSSEVPMALPSSGGFPDMVTVSQHWETMSGNPI